MGDGPNISSSQQRFNYIITAVLTATSATVAALLIGNYIDFTQVATPANPAAGKTRVYVKNDGNLYTLQSDGTEATAGVSLPIVDSTYIVKGSADSGKQLRFEVDGFTTPTQVTLSVLAGKNYTIMSTDASDFTTGTVPTAQFPGGAFNGASQLVQLTAAGKYPALDGSLITNLSSGVSSDADFNTAGGTTAQDSITAGQGLNNTAFGYNANTAITTGDNNVGIGSGALDAATTVSDNIAIGKDALGGASFTASNSVAIGTSTGIALTSGYQSVFVGHNSGMTITTGGDNTALGYNALKLLGGASTSNTAIGSAALGGHAGPYNNSTAIGYRAGNANRANQNTFIGADAGYLVTTGADSLYAGFAAGDGITAGTQNVMLGKDAGGAVTGTGQTQNVFIGHQAGAANTVSENVYIGSGSGDVVATGTRNVFVGTDTCGTAGATTQTDNVLVGYRAGQAIQSDFNVIIGSAAGDGLTTGSQNVFIGMDAGGAAGGTTQTTNVFIGSTAGKANTANNNTYVGALCGDSITTGTRNVAMGKDALGGTSATNVDDSVILGYAAGAELTTGDNNVFVGSGAGDGVTSGSGNVAIGKDAFGATTTGANNVCMGLNAGLVLNTSNVVYIGSGAGDASTGGANSVYIGKDAGGANVSGTDNTYVGYQAGLAATGSNNSFFGNGAGAGLTSGGNNVGLGFGAMGQYATTSTRNCVIGYLAGASGAAATNDNTLLGANSGLNATGGTNTCVGSSAGDTITSGTGNVTIGYGSDTAANNSAGAIAIGIDAVAASNTFVSGSATQAITNVHFGEGTTDGTPLSYTINGTGGSGTDIAGAGIVLAGGKGTGTGNAGYVGVQFPKQLATGTTLQSLSTATAYYQGVLYTSTANATRDNSATTESSIVGAQTNAVPQGTLTLDAGFLRVGTTIEIEAIGQITTDNSAALNIRAKLGSTVIAETTDRTPPVSATNGQFSVKVILTCRSTGATGTVQGNGFVLASADPSASDARSQSMYKAAVTVDTTAQQVLDLTAQWSGTGSSSLTITNCVVKVR